MIQNDWNTINQMLGHMSDAEKKELLARVADSITPAAPADALSAQCQALDAWQAQMAQMPASNPDDDLSSADHDRILYGRPAVLP
jgi:hypothetical protein